MANGNRIPEIMTFHAWALKYLRKFSRESGLRKELDIITEVERNEILKWIADDMNIKLVKFNYRDIIYDIDSAPPDIKIVVQKYLQIMKYYGLLDYDLLIVLFRRLIEDNEDVRNFLHNRYKHVLIDEFQDTNEYIWGIVQRLDPENVFLVGDVDQCLYGFNGARPDIMVGISDCRLGIGDFRLYKMENNYRCPEDVVVKADRLIMNNRQRIDRRMLAKVLNRPEKVDIIYSDDIDRDLPKVITEIGLERDTAILCRTNTDVFRAYQSLIVRDIPCEKYDNSMRMQSPYFRFLVAVLRLVFNPHNAIACKIIYRAYFPNDLLTYKKCQIEANEKDKPVIEILSQTIPFFVTLLEPYQYSYDVFHDVIMQLPVFSLAGRYDKDEDLKRFKKLIDEDPQAKLGDFLANMSMRSVQDEMIKNEEKGIMVMTVHASKGLEFDNVIIYRGDHFPIRRKDSDPEEERRIFYVALTRTKGQEMILCKKDKTVQYVNEITGGVNE